MGTYQIRINQTVLLQVVQNIYYYETTVGEPSDSEFQDIADEIRTLYGSSAMTGRHSNDWAYQSITHRRVDLAGLFSFDKVPTAGGLVGTEASQNLPTQIAFLVTVKGLTTKPNRSRTYIGGMTEFSNEESQWSAGLLTAGKAFIDGMAELNTAGTNPLRRVAAQWNTGHTQVVATNRLDDGIVTAISIPATQRRRRLGVGI